MAILGSSNTSDRDYSVLNIDSTVTLTGGSYGLNVFKTGDKYACGAVVNFGGKLTSAQGFYVHGNVQETSNAPKVNILDGAQVTPTSSAGISPAIYAAGYANWTIGQAKLAGQTSGISTKAGTFVLNNTTITAGAYATSTHKVRVPLLVRGTTNTFDVATFNTNNETEAANYNAYTYGNGIYNVGAVFQIEDNASYADGMSITINGGSYTSENQAIFYEYGHTEGETPKTPLTTASASATWVMTGNIAGSNLLGSLVINGGSFVTRGIFQDGENDLTGQEIFRNINTTKKPVVVNAGTFSHNLDATYLASNRYIHGGSGSYTVDEVPTGSSSSSTSTATTTKEPAEDLKDEPAPTKTYVYLEGENQVIEVGENAKPMAVRINADLKLFRAVYVDGETGE